MRYVHGYNLPDFEPCQYVSNCTDADAAAYAGFLDTFAAALHKHGMELTIDVATWTPFWNYTRLAATRVDRIILMVGWGSAVQCYAAQCCMHARVSPTLTSGDCVCAGRRRTHLTLWTLSLP